MSHERWADSTAAYLLGALPDGERESFEAHLATCAACRDEVEFLRVGADALPASAPQLDPPPALKDRIMAVVRTEAELLAAAGPEADRVAAPAAPAGRRRWWQALLARPAFAVPAVLLLLVAGVGAGVAGTDLLGGDEHVDGVRRIAAEVTFASAEVALEVRDRHCTIVAEGLPAPPAGKEYQVWIKSPGRSPRPTEIRFTPSAAGTASVDIPWRVPDSYDVLVTAEPVGGSKVPTSAPVISASLA